MFLLQLQDISGQPPTLLHEHIAPCHSVSLPETDPQILGRWGFADEDHVGKLLQEVVVFGLGMVA